MKHENLPKVTLIVPTYKRPGLLTECLASIHEQTFDDFLVLVCDNSPEREAFDIVASLQDDRFHYVPRKQNLGIFGNAIAGFQQAQSDYVMEVDDDDRLYPEALEILIRPLLADPDLTLSFADLDVVDDDGRVLTGVARTDFVPDRPGLTEGIQRPFTELAARGRIFMMAAVIRRDAVDWSAIPPSVATAYDRYLALVAAREGKAAYYVGRSVAAYRVHVDGDTVFHASHQLAGALEALRLERPLVDDEARRVLDAEIVRLRVVLMWALSGERGWRAGLREALALVRPRDLAWLFSLGVTDYLPRRMNGGKCGAFSRERRKWRRTRKAVAPNDSVTGEGGQLRL